MKNGRSNWKKQDKKRSDTRQVESETNGIKRNQKDSPGLDTCPG